MFNSFWKIGINPAHYQPKVLTTINFVSRDILILKETYWKKLFVIGNYGFYWRLNK